MTSIDIIHMIGNLSQSLIPVQNLLKMAAYVTGFLFCINGIFRLRELASSTVSSHSSVKSLTPIAYLMGGVALIYLPTAMTTMSNTLFGAGNILQYSSYNPYDINNAMRIVIQTAGILWFIRGCILLVHSSQPGFHHGSKGLAFLIAGVLAMNFQNTANFLSSLMNQIAQVTITIKNYKGY